MTYHTNTITPPSFDTPVPYAQVPTTPPAIGSPLAPDLPTPVDVSGASIWYPGGDMTTYIQNSIFDTVWPQMVGVSTIVSVVVLIAILYAVFRVRQLREIEKVYYQQQPMTAEARHTFDLDDAPASGAAGITRWREVQQHLQGEASASWKQAVLEADVMLDDVITSKGYTGVGLGEKMKQVKRSDINSIDDAWEAHKIRNRIAHDGGDFDISQRDARHVISLYGNVFRELEYIPE